MWPYPERWDLYARHPHTFAALMEMGEANHHLLRRLIPDLGRLPRHAVSQVAGCLDLHLEIVDRWKYTTNLILTYRFRDLPSVVREPNLNIRLYHDAKSAEAISGVLHRAAGELNALDPRFTLHHKWTLNRFLYKWLGYCLHRGHCFRVENSCEERALADPLVTP